MKMLVKFGDNNDKNYYREEFVTVDVETYLVLKYWRKEEIDMDTYDKYYNKLIDNIEKQIRGLPKDWYMD